jgi:hypothetical protein
MRWVEFAGGDDFGELLHVYWLDINNVYSVSTLVPL